MHSVLAEFIIRNLNAECQSILLEKIGKWTLNSKHLKSEHYEALLRSVETILLLCPLRDVLHIES